MRLAIFDLDFTLVPFDTDKGWNEFLIDLGAVDGEAYQEKNKQFYEDYINETLDIREYQRFSCQVFMRYPIDQLRHWRAKFLDEIVKPQIQYKAIKCIRDYNVQGFTTMIISATNTFIVEPIASLHGVDACLGCQFEIKNGQYTGELIGIPTYQSGKVEALNAWLNENNFSPEIIHFYSDSINDRPLLEFADKGFVVRPDKSLATLAQKTGWPTVDFMD